MTGETLVQFFRREIAEPLHIDYNIGLRPDEIERCATFVLPANAGLRKALDAPESPDGLYWAQLRPATSSTRRVPHRRDPVGERARQRARRRTVLRPAGDGGTLDGVRIMLPETIERLRTEQHNMADRIRPRHYHQAVGVVRNSPPVATWVPIPAPSAIKAPAARSASAIRRTASASATG